MAAQQSYDVIVLGLGVMGSATLYHLAQAGQRVLGLEQFEPDHEMGSSIDVSRIFRYAYDHPAYVTLARAAYPMWRALEEEARVSLMHYTGQVDFGPQTSDTFQAFRDTLVATGIAHDWLTPAELAQRFPQFQLSEDMMAIYHAEAGYLAAATCVLTLIQQAQQHGADIQTGAHVQQIDIEGDSVVVRTADQTYSAARLVVTAGSWAGKVLGQLDLTLPLRPTRQQVIFFQTQDLSLFGPDRFPVYIAHGDPWYYGLPSVNNGGLKTAIHNLRDDVVDPDTMNRSVDPAHVEVVRGFLRRCLPLADSAPASTRTCLYTVTPDDHFILDHHPAYPQVVIGAGFSGHGFKFGILIGQILADLALKGTTAHDIALFRLQRFAS